MKRQIIIGALLAAALAGGLSAARAEIRGKPDRGAEIEDGCGPRGKMPHGKRLSHLARELGLSDAQQTQIKAIFTAEREQSAPLMEKLAAYRKQLHDATRAATFDEAAIRTIAANQAQLDIELTVARARMHNQINAVLTTEQRALAEKLRPPVEEGSGHKRPPRFGGEW